MIDGDLIDEPLPSEGMEQWLINEDIPGTRDPATDTSDKYTIIVPQPMPPNRHERRKQARIAKGVTRKVLQG